MEHVQRVEEEAAIALITQSYRMGLDLDRETREMLAKQVSYMATGSSIDEAIRRADGDMTLKRESR